MKRFIDGDAAARSAARLATAIVASALVIVGVAPALAAPVSATVRAQGSDGVADDAAPTELDYTVERWPAASGSVGTGRYAITLRLAGDRNGRTVLRIPGRWAGAEHAERGIESLELLTADARLEDGDAADEKRVVHAPGATLVVRYRLRQIADGEPNVAWPTNYLPVIQPGYFEWIGWTAWIVPANDARPVRARVRFVGLPATWSFASSFGLDRDGVLYEGPLQPFRASLFVGGDFRLRTRAVRGGRLVTAVRGAWSFGDDEVADRLATIVDGERAFWDDRRPRDFLVTMMPVAADAQTFSYNGTGLTDGFATFLTRVKSLDDLDHLFTHEYFHTWNTPALGHVPQPEVSMYWFSEGFTDFFARALRLRWGRMTLTRYAAEYDEVLRSLALLRETDLPNDAIGVRFFRDPRNVGQLPYWRGMLLAARWDAEIRAASGGRRSLDDLMHGLRRQAIAGIDRLDAPRVVAVATVLGVRDAAGDVDHLIERGRPIALADGTLSACVRIEQVADREFDPGFDVVEAMRSRTVTGVNPASPAFAAGLRDGQRIHSIDLYREVGRTASVGVQDGADEPVRVLTFRPGGRSFVRQRATMHERLSAAEITACLAELNARRPAVMDRQRATVPSREVPSRLRPGRPP